MISEALDRTIGVFSPQRALRRAGARALLRVVENTNFSSYKGSVTNRNQADWAPGSGSANADILYELDDLRDKSRDLVRNNSYALSLVNAYVGNVVGTGIRPQSNIDYDAAGVSQNQAIDIQATAESIWDEWSPQADAEEIKDIYDIQAQAMRSICENGESILAVPRLAESSRRTFRLALQMIEPDRLPSTSYDTDPNMVGGIKIGEYGQPLSYRILNYHPGDTAYALSGRDYTDIPRFDSEGRPQIFHLFRQWRAAQRRGVPLLATVVGDLKDASSYIEAELVANRVAACISLFIRRLDPSGDVLGSSELSASGIRLENLSPGIIGRLAPGEEPVAFNPQRPGVTFEPFMRWIMKAVSAALDIPYEVLAKDFAGMNYSSARTAILDARRVFVTWQDWLSRKLLQPVYDLLMEEAFLQGRFAGLGVNDFYGLRHYLCQCTWIAQGWDWVDPLNEARALDIALKANITSLKTEYGKKGEDWEKALNQIAREKAMMDELGISAVIPGGESTPADNDNKTDDEESPDAKDDKDKKGEEDDADSSPDQKSA